jgi:hypothetical protein
MLAGILLNVFFAMLAYLDYRNHTQSHVASAGMFAMFGLVWLLCTAIVSHSKPYVSSSVLAVRWTMYALEYVAAYIFSALYGMGTEEPKSSAATCSMAASADAAGEVAVFVSAPAAIDVCASAPSAAPSAPEAGWCDYLTAAAIVEYFGLMCPVVVLATLQIECSRIVLVA